jgi:predicted nucleic acid-binding Zn finger protein
MIVETISKHQFKIIGETDKYVVDLDAKTCTCPDYKFRGRICKHLKFLGVQQ